MAGVRVNRSLVQAMANLRGPVGRKMQRFAHDVQRGAQMRVGVRSGRLRKSITVREGRRGTTIFFRVGPTRVFYADMHQHGTRPHVIKARQTKTLKFKPRGGGRAVYRQQVRHPGTKPNPYMTEAYRAAVRRFQ